MHRSLIKLWLFIAFFLPLTISLGFWQIDRAEQKTKLQQDFSDAQKQTPRQYSIERGLKDFVPVVLEGSYIAPPILLDNRTRDGKVGYEVLSIFETLSGDHALVNRGWIVAPKLRDKLPMIETPSDLVVLEGLLISSTENQSAMAEQFPNAKRVQGVDWEWIIEEYELRIPERWQVRLTQPESPGALNLDWPSQSFSPDKHYGYAVQWFGLALALAVLGAMASYKIIKQDRVSDESN